VKVAGRWIYLYRAIDQFGQVIDVLVSQQRDLPATRRFFARALEHGPCPSEVSTGRAPAYPRVIDELPPAACHITEQYANNPIEADHGRLKARLRPMRGLKKLRSARVISAGHSFMQNLRRGPYETRCRCRPEASAPGRPRRTHPRHLSEARQQLNPRFPSTQQCPRTRQYAHSQRG
jgi:transposase-like protein